MQIKGGISSDDFLSTLRNGRSEVGLTLGEYVREWVDTGLNADDSEEPLKRTLYGTAAYRALQRYLSENPPVIMATFRTAWQGGDPQRQGKNASTDGLYSIFGVNPPHKPVADVDQACRLFALMIDSSWHSRLFRCRRCGDYGLLKKKAREHYKRGIHCEKCKNKATATASTAKDREERDAKRLEAAAAAWRAWKPSCRGLQKDWVVLHANRRLDLHDRITKKWITRNLSKIEAKATEGTR